MAVYDALLRVQSELDGHETLGIAPRVPFRTRDRTFRLDLLVTYRGRVGIIEVDGASHRHKWSDDRSRDQLVEDCGVNYVYRIDAEDTTDPRLLDEHIRRFLKRLVR